MGSKMVVKCVSCVRGEFFPVKNDGRGRDPGELRNWKNVGGSNEGRNDDETHVREEERERERERDRACELVRERDKGRVRKRE